MPNTVFVVNLITIRNSTVKCLPNYTMHTNIFYYTFVSIKIYFHITFILGSIRKKLFLLFTPNSTITISEIPLITFNSFTPWTRYHATIYTNTFNRDGVF